MAAPRRAEDVFAAAETDLAAAEVQMAKALAALSKAHRAYALADLALKQSKKRRAATAGGKKAVRCGKASGEEADD